ncbi:unnamed protein product [Parajaminaea phylloscopi]
MPAKKQKLGSRPGKAADISTSSRSVGLDELQWKPVSIPAMALSSDRKGKGSSSSLKARGKGKAADRDGLDEEQSDAFEGEWDPFADLDEGADDFMGLQEVTGVGIRFEGDDKMGKRIGFYQKAERPQESLQGTKKSKAPKVNRKQQNGATQEPIAAKDVDTPQHSSSSESGPDTDTVGNDVASQQQPKAEQIPVEMHESTALEPPSSSQSDLGGQSKEDAAIPQGIFSAFAAELGEDDDFDDAAEIHLADQHFDDRSLPHWPAEVLQNLHPLLKRALVALKFQQPTPVQSRTLPYTTSAVEHPTEHSYLRDVVALAQTGSGKTLAYALPILQKVLASRAPAQTDEDDSDVYTRPLQALVVLPTRELALQVYQVFRQLVTASLDGAATSESGSSAKPWVRVAPVVGGMSEERQWRLLRGRKSKQANGSEDAEIIVATVGRLWELCKSDDYLPSRLHDAQTLVLDEADRLLETGKYQELSSILSLLTSPSRQSMMFSATLDATLQVNLTKSRSKVAKMLKQAKGGSEALMAKLIEQVGFQDPEGAELIDLTQDAKVSESLKEGKVECLETEKDLYLYYLLLRYPGSFLVFLNSIDSVRRLQPLLSNLGINCFGLHGEMDQRARLRSLDGFKKSFSSGGGRNGKKPAPQQTSSASVLLATDVAARGLDIPLVSYVVHFHLPRSADTYIHRSGRTARAGQSGLSLLLLAPGEKGRWTSLRRNMGREGGPDLKDLPVTHGIVGRLKTRVRLAKELDEARHRNRKAKADDDWVKKLADEADIALDDDGDIDPDADYSVRPGSGAKSGKAAAAQQGAIRGLEKQLAHELSQDLVARGVKRKFITQGAGFGGATLGGDLLRDLVSGTGHGTFLGLPQTQANTDLEAAGAKGGAKKTKVAKKA